MSLNHPHDTEPTPRATPALAWPAADLPAADHWDARGRRLRQINVLLAALPAQWLSEEDENERQRLHAWVTTQQGFIADLGEAVRLRAAYARQEEALTRDEQLLLTEVDRFADQTEAALAQGRERRER